MVENSVGRRAYTRPRETRGNEIFMLPKKENEFFNPSHHNELRIHGRSAEGKTRRCRRLCGKGPFSHVTPHRGDRVGAQAPRNESTGSKQNAGRKNGEQIGDHMSRTSGRVIAPTQTDFDRAEAIAAARMYATLIGDLEKRWLIERPTQGEARTRRCAVARLRAIIDSGLLTESDLAALAEQIDTDATAEVANV
jgi:hypothetical protein